MRTCAICPRPLARRARHQLCTRHAAEYSGFVAELRTLSGGCEAGDKIRVIRPGRPCRGPIDPHHRRLRQQGGAWMLRANVLMVCRDCHALIHSGPFYGWALELGFLVPRFKPSGDPHPEFDELAQPRLAA